MKYLLKEMSPEADLRASCIDSLMIFLEEKGAKFWAEGEVAARILLNSPVVPENIDIGILVDSVSTAMSLWNEFVSKPRAGVRMITIHAEISEDLNLFECLVALDTEDYQTHINIYFGCHASLPCNLIDRDGELALSGAEVTEHLAHEVIMGDQSLSELYNLCYLLNIARLSSSPNISESLKDLLSELPEVIDTLHISEYLNELPKFIRNSEFWTEFNIRYSTFEIDGIAKMADFLSEVWTRIRKYITHTLKVYGISINLGKAVPAKFFKDNQVAAQFLASIVSE